MRIMSRFLTVVTSPVISSVGTRGTVGRHIGVEVESVGMYVDDLFLTPP